MDIRQTFLNLTKFTYIHGNEYLLEKYMPSNIQKDKFGNYFIKIGESSTMFTCHLDTASRKFEPVKHVFKNNLIYSDGSTILGADDKAGMTILLYMIEKNVPGLYYFFIGEEVGCVGSNAASNLDFSMYKRCISFDRRGYSSIITHQLGQRCCSEKFANSICEEFKTKNLFYEPDPTGVVTDSAMFTEQIPECTNISVGYNNEHTKSEYQDILYLKKLSQACIELEWDSLPVERSIVKIKSLNNWGPADEEFFEEEVYTKKIENEQYCDVTVKISINDREYLAKVKDSKLEEEKYFIKNWIDKSVSYEDVSQIEWDGQSCYLIYEDYFREYIGEREELIHVIDQLDDISLNDLKILKVIK